MLIVRRLREARDQEEFERFMKERKDMFGNDGNPA